MHKVEVPFWLKWRWEAGSSTSCFKKSPDAMWRTLAQKPEELSPNAQCLAPSRLSTQHIAVSDRWSGKASEKRPEWGKRLPIRRSREAHSKLRSIGAIQHVQEPWGQCGSAKQGRIKGGIWERQQCTDHIPSMGHTRDLALLSHKEPREVFRIEKGQDLIKKQKPFCCCWG